MALAVVSRCSSYQTIISANLHAKMLVMRQSAIFYRNARAGELLELFLVAAISSVLITRFLLHIAGYPSVGGRSLHIAHILYGGAFMTAAMVLLLGFLGMRMQRFASVLGGVGFGLFIDELGKFITRDNNYFFKPTVALMYLVFIGLFVAARSISRTRRLTEREYLLNALMIMEEVVIEDLEEAERGRALFYLNHANQEHPLVAPLKKILHEAKAEPEDPDNWLVQALKRAERVYQKLIASRWGVTIIDLIFIGNAIVLLVDTGADVVNAFVHHTVGQQALASFLGGLSSVVSAGFVLAGAAYIRNNRTRAYEFFMKALLINIFVTQFFSFYLREFEALPGFIINLILYAALSFLLRHERRSAYRTHPRS